VPTSPAQLRYLADAVNTASPAQLIVMLYDRLLLDIRRGIDLQSQSDRVCASVHIRHGQEIIAELRASLRTDEWSGADDLAALYGFLLVELVEINGAPDVNRLTAVEAIVCGLRDSWRTAAISLLQASDSATANTRDVTARQVAWVG
jgi:flagellar protein FliS